VVLADNLGSNAIGGFMESFLHIDHVDFVRVLVLSFK
jgi:hypothetical protein